MPLPPAPTKRAALLSPEAFRQSAASASANETETTTESIVDNLAQPDTAPVAAASRSRKKATATATTTATAAPKRAPAKTAKASTAKAAPVQAPAPAVVAKSAPSQPAAAVAATKATPVNKAKTRAARSTGPKKMFVLDTNVLLHDPTSLFRFEEHDIFLPMIVLEELDGHKKGMTEVARNGRQVSRTLDALAAADGEDIVLGLNLNATGQRAANGKLYFQTSPLDYTLPSSLPQGKADNQILGVVEALRQQYAPREVVLVSKDINMRVKARALGLDAEDYQNDKTLEDGDLLYSGVLALPSDFWA